MKKIYIFGGGTFSHVRSHLALAAPAFGNTARQLFHIIESKAFHAFEEPVDVQLLLTKMADSESNVVTNADVARVLDQLIADPATRVIIFNVALCDYEGQVAGGPSGKYATRLKTADGDQGMILTPAEKLIGRIRRERKDIFVVGFKTTAGATEDEQRLAGLSLLKRSSLNLVLANDVVTRRNMIITPEEAVYANAVNEREACLKTLAGITLSRCKNTFTRSTVVSEVGVAWSDARIPDNLRAVVEHCIARGAYKPFNGATVGHFAVKIDETSAITSRRKRDFNRLPDEGMVRIVYEDDETVKAYGGKPSVGGQSQRIIFKEHADADCIVHFHCPLREDAEDIINEVKQWPNECGSHQCGQATSSGLRPQLTVGGRVKAVMLDNHGPNIVFSRDTSAEDVIQFIERNWDLSEKTGGYV